MPSPTGGLASEYAEVQFTRGQLGPFIYQGVARTDEASAQRVMDDARALPEPCDWEETDRDGEVTSWRMRAMSFPAIGDDSVAYRMSATASITAVEVDVVLIRRGDITTALVHIAAGLGSANVDSALTERLACMVDDRMVALTR